MSSESAPTPARQPAATWTVPQRPALVAALAVLVIAAGVIGYVAGSGGSAPTGRITATGSSTVMGVPDSVSFSIGVHTTNVNAQVCLNDNSRRVTSLEASLASAGASKKGMQTSNLDLYDNTNDHGQVTGFTVDDTLNVTMSVAKVGHAIEVAARSAGSGVELNGISFSLVNDAQLMAGARSQAMTAAHEEAVDLAHATGASLAGVVTITDHENEPSAIDYPVALNDYVGATAVPIEAGQQAVTVQVSVVYALSS